MSDEYQEFDPSQYINNIQTTVSPATQFVEHNPEDYFKNITVLEQPKTFSKTLEEKSHNILKNAEFFANPGRFMPKSAKQFAQSAASLADTTIGSAIPAAGSYLIQGVTRPFTTPEKAAEYGQEFASATDKPFGKAFGITNELSYKNEASNRLMQFVSENMDKGADYISQQTGLPKEDVAHMMNSLTIAGTHATNTYVVPKVKTAVGKMRQAFEEKQAELESGTPFKSEQSKGFAEPKGQVTVQQVGSQIAPEGVPNNFGQTAQIATLETPKERSIEVPLELPENRAETSPFTPDELKQRETLLNKIGLDQVRQSALEGNPKEASSQFITSQADQGPYGSGMTQQINLEKEILDNHFNKIQEEAGGTTIRHGTPFQEGDKIKVGKTIKDALQEGYESHQKETTSLYKEATNTLGNTPVELKGFNDFLNADENFAYQNEKGLQTGIKQFMNRKGFLDESGNVKPLTVAQAEQVRQYINSKYHYETKQLGGQLKGLLDNDVFETVGGETYQKARKHYQKGIEVYDNPKAMGNLLADEGVNQKIPDEKVASTVVNLPHSQFEHLFNTLEADGQATAVNQLKTSLVEQIRQAGQSAKNQPFNSVAAAKEAANLGEKLNIAFRNDPKGLEAIYDGLEAANILHIPNKYPGAAIQSHLLNNKFSEIAVQRAGAVAGGAAGSMFGPVGAGVGAAGGEFLGGKAATRMRTKRQAEQLEKEIKTTKLSDMNTGK